MLEGQQYTFGAKTDFVDILRCPDITKENNYHIDNELWDN